MIDLHPRHRSVLLDLLREKADAEQAGSRARDALLPPGLQLAVARALRNNKPFLVLAGGAPSQAERALDESLRARPGRMQVARAAAQREAPLTLAMLLERILDRAPGTLRSSNLESAISAVTRGVAGVKIDRVLVIDEAEHTPRDVLGRLAVLPALLGSNGLSLKVILLGERQSLQRCIPAGAGSDVIDLDACLHPSASAHGHAPAPAGSLPTSGTVKQDGTEGKARRHGGGVALGLLLLLAAGVSSAAYLKAFDAPYSVHHRPQAASPNGNAPLVSDLARPSAERTEAPAASQPAAQAEQRATEEAPAPPPVIPDATSTPDAAPASAPPTPETPRPDAAHEPQAGQDAPAPPPVIPDAASTPDASPASAPPTAETSRSASAPAPRAGQDAPAPPPVIPDAASTPDASPASAPPTAETSRSAPAPAPRAGQDAPAPPPVIPDATSTPDASPASAPPTAETSRSAPAPAPPAESAERALPAAVVETLMRRGAAALADGDVGAARLLFERAASSNAAAALALGKTYDPDFLAQLGARGVQPDRAAAAFWYGKAKALGDPDATRLADRLRTTLRQ